MSLKIVNSNPLVSKAGGNVLAGAILDGTGAKAFITGKDPPVVNLFNAPVVISADMVIGDFVAHACVFSGYGAQVAPCVELTDPGGNRFLGGVAPLSFIGANPLIVPDIVYGVYITDSTGAFLIAAQLLDVPFPVVLALDEIQLFYRIPLLWGQGLLV